VAMRQERGFGVQQAQDCERSVCTDRGTARPVPHWNSPAFSRSATIIVPVATKAAELRVLGLQLVRCGSLHGYACACLAFLDRNGITIILIRSGMKRRFEQKGCRRCETCCSVSNVPNTARISFVSHWVICTCP